MYFVILAVFHHLFLHQPPSIPVSTGGAYVVDINNLPYNYIIKTFILNVNIVIINAM